MGKHISNICNLSNIDGEKVKFITTDNFGVTQSLKNTGDIVLLRDNDRHDIYVAGEHIAGGYGFDNDDTLDTLNTVAVSYYSYIQYVGENYETIKKVVDEYRETEPDSDNQDTQIGDIEPYINISYIGFKLPNVFDTSKILEYDPFVVVAGTPIEFKEISLDIDGNCNIGCLDLYSYEWFRQLDDVVVCSKEYTNYVIEVDPTRTTKYSLNADNYQHSEEDGSNVNELRLYGDGSPENYTDNLLVVIKDERYTQIGYITEPQEFKSIPIYWQLPYLYGTVQITSGNFNEYSGTTKWRVDCSVDTMIETEISIQFSDDFASRSYGYFACPAQWGEPRFTHKNSGLTHYWEKINENLECNINGLTVYYNVYKTKIEYFKHDPIVWIVSNK